LSRRGWKLLEKTGLDGGYAVRIRRIVLILLTIGRAGDVNKAAVLHGRSTIHLPAALQLVALLTF
jgi:hypothetical protein